MSERYSKLFALPENLYATGSPVVIAAGALLKDNQTGKVIAQLKMRNINQKPIKAAKVSIHPLDTVGNPLGEKIEYQYLDLSAARDEDFGQKAPVALPDSTTRSFAASVEEVAFTDNTVWTATGEPWKMLPQPQPIGLIHGAELEKQFRMKYGSDCKNLLLIERDLWFCVCGALNHSSETECHACRKTLAILNSIDFDELNRQKNARLAEEKEIAEQKAEAARAKAEEERVRAKKNKKIASIVLPIVAVIIVTAVIISGTVKKNNAYNDALALMDAGQYEEAIKAFTDLDGYKDSAEQIQIAENTIELETTYNNAIQLLKSDVSANENEAYHILMEIGDYKDAKELLADFQYAIITETAESNIENNGDYTRNYEYDARGLLTAKSHNGGTYAYDTNGRLIKAVGSANWSTTEYSYHDNGNISRVKHAQSRSTSSGRISYLTTDYDVNGNPIRIKDEFNGGVWTFTYNFADDGTIETIDCTRSLTNREDSTTVNLVDNDLELFHTVKDWTLFFKSKGENENQTTIYAVIFDYYDGLVVVKRREYEYDTYGNLTRETSFNNAGNQNYAYRYENSYDQMGNLTQVKRHSVGSDVIVAYNYIYGYIYTPDAQ